MPDTLQKPNKILAALDAAVISLDRAKSYMLMQAHDPASLNAELEAYMQLQISILVSLQSKILQLREQNRLASQQDLFLHTAGNSNTGRKSHFENKQQ